MQQQNISEQLSIVNVTLPNSTGRYTIKVDNGKVAGVFLWEEGQHSGTDGKGLLAIPAFVDGHVHLDKTFVGIPWVPHRGPPDVRSRILVEKQLRNEHQSTRAQRAERLAETMLSYGTTALRTHVDVDDQTRLSGVEMLLDLRERFSERMDMQIVAFPQSGLWASGDVVSDLESALRSGADVIGGVDPTLIDCDAERSLDTIFGLADRFAVGVDLHLHEPGEMGAAVIRGMCDRTDVMGLAGKVVVSHGFCLSNLDDRSLQALGERMAQAGVALMTSAPGDGRLVPIAKLSALGVSVFTASDNIRDAWSPFGNGDMLDRASRLAWRGDMRNDQDLQFAFNCATRKPAQVLGFSSRSIEIGDEADFVLIPAPSIEEAVCSVPAHRRVFRKGREIVQSQEPATV